MSGISPWGHGHPELGADRPCRQELDPLLAVPNKIVTDVLDHCPAIRELDHALEAGLVERTDVHAELGQLVTGQKAGRTADEEITVFDSTGMAPQDVAAAAVV